MAEISSLVQLCLGAVTATASCRMLLARDTVVGDGGGGELQIVDVSTTVDSLRLPVWAESTWNFTVLRTATRRTIVNFTAITTDLTETCVDFGVCLMRTAWSWLSHPRACLPHTFTTYPDYRTPRSGTLGSEGHTPVTDGRHLNARLGGSYD